MAHQMLIALVCCALYAVATAEFPMCAIPNQYPCDCTRDMDPVCGRDGLWYNNPCELRCANQKWNYKACCPAESYPGIQILAVNDNSDQIDSALKEKKCKKDGYPCPCTKEFDPVCGTDDKWYNNLCELECLGNNVKATADSCCTAPKPGLQLAL